MRTARPPPLPHSGRGPYGRVPVHRGLVQPPPPPLRPRLSVANQLRKESLLKAVIRKPSAVHRNGVTPGEAYETWLGCTMYRTSVLKYLGRAPRPQKIHRDRRRGQV